MASSMSVTSSPCRTNSRYYQQAWPDVGELVMARVMNVQQLVSYVTLPEYGNQEAMLPHSELSRRRIRSVHKLVRPAMTLCVRVMRVNPEKNYVDVSKRQVDEDKEQEDCVHRYNRGKAVQSVIRRLGELTNMTSLCELEDLNQRVAWRLNTIYDNDTASYDAFERAYSDPSVLDALKLDPEILKHLKQVIDHRFALKTVKFRGEVDVMCVGKDGVDAIKAALNAGKKASSADIPVEIYVLAAPTYSVSCQALTNQTTEAMESMQKAFEAIETTILQYSGGIYKLRVKPRTVDIDNDETPADQADDAEEKENGGDEEEDADIGMGDFEL